MNFSEIAVQLAGHAALLFGWRPEEFWNATPAELAAIVAAGSSADAAASGQTLADLMQKFPDAPTGDD